jgi:hypothetical protein
MIEIGKAKTIVVRERKGGKLVPKLDAVGKPETRIISANTFRVTRDELDGSFGRDRGRKLVVGLIAGDVLTLRVQRAKQPPLTAKLSDIFRWLVHNKANRENMEKLRERKKLLAERREQRRRDAKERRFRKSLRTVA